MNTQTSYFKKALVVLMAVMMVFTMMPSMAWAAEDTAGNEAQQEETTLTPTFKGTATHGYVKDISFGEVQFKEEEKIEQALGYAFDPNTTEYSVTLTDAFIGFIQFKANEGVSGYKASMAYYDEGEQAWKTFRENQDFSVVVNGMQLPTESMSYDKPTIVRVAFGPTVLDGTQPKVDLEQADIYYYSITREAALTNINAGTDYPLSPPFDKYGNTTTYNVYGSFTDDTEIKLTLQTGDSKVAVLNKVYANGAEADGTSSSRTFSAKYLELWSDTDGRKYVKIEVMHPSVNGEILGKTYKVYFLNEQKVNFTTQPVGGTFEPGQKGDIHTLSVAVDAPEGATIKYLWRGSRFSTKWSAFNPAFADRATRETPNLSVDLSNKGKFRFFCQVTLTIDGVDYVANSETVDVYILDDGKVSGPNLSNTSVLTPRTYYQDENAVQLTAAFSPIDAGTVTTMQWYVSEHADGSNPVKLPTEVIKGSVVSGTNGAVTPDTSKVGTFYYYCGGTSSLEEGGKN